MPTITIGDKSWTGERSVRVDGDRVWIDGVLVEPGAPEAPLPVKRASRLRRLLRRFWK